MSDQRVLNRQARARGVFDSALRDAVKEGESRLATRIETELLRGDLDAAMTIVQDALCDGQEGTE